MPTVEQQLDEHGMETVVLREPSGGSARVYLQGAHVTSWRTADGKERLFLSRAARFEQGVAIRGGIPVIFPQFADRGPLGKHGFARLSRWRLMGDDGTGSVRFSLEDSDQTRATWPARFSAELRVTLRARELVVELAVTARSRLEFTAALHSYLRVADVGRVVVTGLRGVPFESRLEGVERAAQGDDELRVTGELDRVYYDVPGAVTVEDATKGGRVVAEGEEFPDVVLWNPGLRRAGGLGDMVPEEYREMLCVEAAAIGRPIRLGAGARWRGQQRLRVEG